MAQIRSAVVTVAILATVAIALPAAIRPPDGLMADSPPVAADPRQMGRPASPSPVGDGVVVYSMGDLIFDLPRSEQTDEGLIVELTFVGRHLAQVDLHPTIELDRSQPNLLDPVGDGRVVLDRVRGASKSFLHW